MLLQRKLNSQLVSEKSKTEYRQRRYHRCFGGIVATISAALLVLFIYREVTLTINLPPNVNTLYTSTTTLRKSIEKTSLLVHSEVSKEVQGKDDYFRPGLPWVDKNGAIIHAHGGSIYYEQSSRTYYWYGEDKNGQSYKREGGLTRVDFIGINCYSSRDLLLWEFSGKALSADTSNSENDLHPSKVVERPRVLYNKRRKEYVMWVHIDDWKYSTAQVGIATSKTPCGPYRYIGKQKLHDSESRDFTLFKDKDGTAYVFYSSESNAVMHVGKLSEDYLTTKGPMKRILLNQKRESPAVFKLGKMYYMITSGCSGWLPNSPLIHMASSPLGPWIWKGQPCEARDTLCLEKTFHSQGTFVLPLPGFKNLFLFLADRWVEANLSDSRYVWLPLYAYDDLRKPNFTIKWYDKWKVPSKQGEPNI